MPRSSANPAAKFLHKSVCSCDPGAQDVPWNNNLNYFSVLEVWSPMPSAKILEKLDDTDLFWRVDKNTNLAVTLNYTVWHLSICSWFTNSSVETWSTKKWNGTHSTTLPLLTWLVYVLLQVLFMAGCQCNKSGRLLYIFKSFFVVCAEWRMCCVTFFTCHPLNAVSICCTNLQARCQTGTLHMLIHPDMALHIVFYIFHIYIVFSNVLIIWK